MGPAAFILREIDLRNLDISGARLNALVKEYKALIRDIGRATARDMMREKLDTLEWSAVAALMLAV